MANYFMHKGIPGYLAPPYKLIVIKSNYELLVTHVSVNKITNSGFGTIQK